MNDEPSSSAAAASVHNDEPDQQPSATDIAERRRGNRRMFNRKRGELLDDLLQSIDILVYAELSCIYHMDCFFWRFFLRVMVQFIMLTPKPSMLPDAPSENKPFIGAILGSNVLCIILHAIQDAPSAGEATRGYMHGGLAMDFIGQKGPTSKIHLLLLDLLVVFLQLLQLAVLITSQRLKESSKMPRTGVSRRSAATRQNLDAEERGVRRSNELQDIEMQNLNPSAATEPDIPLRTGDSGITEQVSSHLATAPEPRTDANIFDAFNSGQIVIADLDIPQTVSEQFWSFQFEPEENAEHARNVRANITGQLLRLRLGRFGGRTLQSV